MTELEGVLNGPLGDWLGQEEWWENPFIWLDLEEVCTLSDTYLEATPSTAGIVMARWDEGSSLVTNFCINLALLRRMEARNLEKEPLRLVRPTHFGNPQPKGEIGSEGSSSSSRFAGQRCQVEFEGEKRWLFSFKYKSTASK